jgi:RNA polymerase sigma factor (sigma-70 family)
MVLRVCRRVLHHEQDAEDAFQATFLVLAQNTRSIRKRDALAEWLHGVAYRTSMKAKRSAARRRNHEGRLRTLTGTQATSPTWDDVQAVLDEEIQRLPEMFRKAFVLCVLEGKSAQAAAAELGIKEGTVWSRLTRARRRLQQQLARRGIELSALLAALSVAESAGQAGVSASLASAALRTGLLVAAGGTAAGVIPERVLTLAAGVTRAMFLTKATFAAAILMMLSLFAGSAGLITQKVLADKPTPGKTATLPTERKTDVPANEEQSQQPQTDAATELLTVNGRVFDPAGNPVAGACLHSFHGLKDHPSLEHSAAIQHGTTSGDGRFAVKLPRNQLQPGHFVTLIAAADGFGLDWIELSGKDEGRDVTLRLVKDTPIRGRIVAADGKPIRGIAFNVTGVSAADDDDQFLKALQDDWRVGLTRNLYWPKNDVLQSARSDNDGRFEIKGVGANRWVVIEMIKDTIARTRLVAVTHKGLDLKAINEAVARNRRGSLPVYGPAFEHTAEPGRVVEGTVREAGTGRPVAGVIVTAEHHALSNRPVTDARGHYRFAGLLRSHEYKLSFAPPADAPLIGRSALIRDGDGLLDPVPGDVELQRGVVITGRVFDQVTGKGVLTRLHFHALPGNNFANTASEGFTLVTMTDDDGRFRLVSIPGSGVLAGETVIRRTGNNAQVSAYLGSIYKPGKFGADDRKRVKIIEAAKDSPVFVIAGGIFGLDAYNVYKVVDLKEGEAASYDLAVDPGKTVNVNLEDPEGKPLGGVTAWGVTAMRSGGIALTTAACPVYALDPDNPRQLAFLHRERGLAAAVTVRGDEPGPLTVRLERTGVITGRALDADGQPMARARVGVRYATHWGDGIVDLLQFRDELPHADENGRFRVEGVVPGLKFELGFVEGGQKRFLPKTWLQVKPLAPGQTLDLGDVSVKPPELRAEDSWRYVVPAVGAAFANLPPRPLVLNDRKPSDLKESVSYRGRRQRYAQLIYGTGRTAVVSIVVDEAAPNDVDLYIDADRTGKITAKDRVAGDNLMWRVRLQAVVPEGIVLRQYPRTVFFQYGRESQTLSVATCGYWEGQVVLNGKPVTVRRVDGDANGLLADPQDRICVDVKRDATWNPADTEFRFAPILRLGEQGFAVCADEFGKQFRLAPLQGTGTLRLALPQALKPDQVEEIQVRLQSREGVMVALRNLDAAVTVPSGDYRVRSLRLTLKDPKGGLAWGYLFSDKECKDFRWHRLDPGATLTIDPIGHLDFIAAIGGKREARAGELLGVSPALYTGDGLLIERAYRGGFQSWPSDSGCAGQITLVGQGSRVLDSARTGFS